MSSHSTYSRSPQRHPASGSLLVSRRISRLRVAVFASMVFFVLCGSVYLHTFRTAARGARAVAASSATWQSASLGVEVNTNRFASISTGYSLTSTDFRASMVTGVPASGGAGWRISNGSEAPYWSIWRTAGFRQRCVSLREHAVGIPGIPVFILSYTEPEASEVDAIVQAPLQHGILTDPDFGRVSGTPATLRTHASGLAVLLLLALVCGLAADRVYNILRRSSKLPGSCPHCAYPLVQGQPVCPECGTTTPNR